MLSRFGSENEKLCEAESNASVQTRTACTPSRKSTKRFSGLDFYRPKLFLDSSSPPITPSKNSSDPLVQAIFENKEQLDPTRGFHLLISTYYLVLEKLGRDRMRARSYLPRITGKGKGRVYGPGHFASTQLSLPIEGETPSIYAEGFPAPSTTLPPRASPMIPSTPPKLVTSVKAGYNMPLPFLPPPETPHYSGMSYESPSPTTPQATFAQPQPKTDVVGTAIPPRHPHLPTKKILTFLLQGCIPQRCRALLRHRRIAAVKA